MTLPDSRYEIPKRRTTMQMLPKKYRQVRATVEILLAEAEHISLATDLWTSRATKSDNTLTGHFLTTSWDSRSIVVETFNLTCEHTVQNIASTLQRIVKEWKTENKVVAIKTYYYVLYIA